MATGNVIVQRRLMCRMSGCQTVHDRPRDHSLGMSGLVGLHAVVGSCLQVVFCSDVMKALQRTRRALRVPHRHRCPALARADDSKGAGRLP